MMELGLTPWHFADRSAAGLSAQAVLAESLGYRSFWLPENHFNPAAIPDPLTRGLAREKARGEIPSPLAPPPGCTFNPRCPHATDHCRTSAPTLAAVEEGHLVSCWRAEEFAPVAA